DEHEALRESIRAFVQREIVPHVEAWEQTTFPDTIVRRMGELGFLGLSVPEEYGGQGGDYYTNIILAEERGRSGSGGLRMGSAVLGQPGRGFHQIMWELQAERLIGASGSLAYARWAFDRTLQYAKDRQAFGRPIGSFQAIRHKVARMALQLEATQQLIYATA